MKSDLIILSDPETGPDANSASLVKAGSDQDDRSRVHPALQATIQAARSHAVELDPAEHKNAPGEKSTNGGIAVPMGASCRALVPRSSGALARPGAPSGYRAYRSDPK